MKIKKVPERMCVGCTEMKPKKKLIRIVKSKDGDISIDLVGKAPGRGAYICQSIECLDKAFKTRRLERNLSHNIQEEIYLKLRNQINNEE